MKILLRILLGLLVTLALAACTPSGPTISSPTGTEADVWVEFDGDGYVGARVTHGEVIAQVRCFRDGGPYVLPYSIFKNGDRTEPIPFLGCLGTSTDQSVEIAFASNAGTRIYTPECEVEGCNLDRQLVADQYIGSLRKGLWRVKLGGDAKLVLIAK